MSGNNGKLPASDYCRARGNQSKSLSTVLRQHGRKLGGAAEHLIYSLYVLFLCDTCTSIKRIVQWEVDWCVRCRIHRGLCRIEFLAALPVFKP